MLIYRVAFQHNDESQTPITTSSIALQSESVTLQTPVDAVAHRITSIISSNNRVSKHLNLRVALPPGRFGEKFNTARKGLKKEQAFSMEQYLYGASG